MCTMYYLLDSSGDGSNLGVDTPEDGAVCQGTNNLSYNITVDQKLLKTIHYITLI